jgi:4-hydroxy-tetrahydrodipicolinate reductase
MIKVGVVGAAGRMGATVCNAVAADPDLELVAAVDPAKPGAEVHGLRIAGELKALADAGAQVVVDFTVAEAARVTLPWLAMHDMHAVVGTTGFTAGDIESFRSVFGSSNCLIAANFAIGAVLMMRFAELAAPFFDTAEIVEIHHDGKADSPSGTAIATAQRMAATNSSWANDPTTHEAIPGARGAKGPGNIPIHAIQGQTLTIRHDTVDRVSFMPGVVLACKKIGGRKGVTLGLDDLLGI